MPIYNPALAAIAASRMDPDDLPSHITACQGRLKHAMLMLADLDSRLSVLYPTPADDCDDATFDCWNDAYETARSAGGGYAMDNARRSEEALLIALCGRALQDIAAKQGADAAEAHSTAFGAATGLGRRYSYTAHRQVLDLCIRLDASTL